MPNQNIWNEFDFSEEQEESAYDLLSKQSEALIVATSGELKMEVEAIDSYLDETPPIPVALYMLYVVAPNLGDFRRKILTVVEGKSDGRFPVDIFCHIDNQRNDNISKDDFMGKISEILKRQMVKTSIENLYKQSKDYSKNLPTEE